MKIMASDLVTNSADSVELQVRRRLFDAISNMSTQGYSVYGKNLGQDRPDWRFVTNMTGYANEADLQIATNLMFAAMRHSKYISENVIEIFHPLFDGNPSVTVKRNGIISVWNDSWIGEFIGVTPTKVAEMYSDCIEYLPESARDNYAIFSLAEPRLSYSFIGDPMNSRLVRSTWQAKRDALIHSAQRVSGLSVDNDDYGNIRLSFWLHARSEFLSLREVNAISGVIDNYKDYKPSIYDIRNLTDALNRAQASRQRVNDAKSGRESAAKFANYWANLKSTIHTPDTDTAHAHWAAIPVKAEGFDTSRTWGIEVETVRADSTTRPPGWDSRYDGSLPSGDSCSCDCDSCYDGDHCDYDDCQQSVSSREFVSPILRHYNSAGLRSICNDLGTDIHEDPAAGIHVHVGASDLTIADVTRLLVSYSIIEPLLTPILHRKDYNYCRASSSNSLRWWLSKLRNYNRINPDAVPTPADLIRDTQPPEGRYVDVNVHSLTVHETIEFRSMGAWYDYHHLIRWAWFVREMVNVSKLGIDQKEWQNCRSIEDVVKVLRAYGSEMPLHEEFEDANADDLDLSSELKQECESVVA